MRCQLVFVLSVLLAVSLSHSQQSAPRDAAPPNSDTTSGPYKIGGRISAPVAIHDPAPPYSKYGRKKKIEGICVIGLIVDAHGMPQNVHVVRSLEPSLDQNAIERITTWRFKAALKDGSEPVPVEITVEVDFHLR
ncbi:MAG: energy transducer TonB [Terracidiphilus sp.]|jgi:TonB family protein